jgi:hypothetical protein
MEEKRKVEGEPRVRLSMSRTRKENCRDVCKKEGAKFENWERRMQARFAEREDILQLLKRRKC